MRTASEKPLAGLHPRVTRAIWRAVILELARHGYDGLTMEQVARRARVGKAALYRRWPGKEAMVLEMIGAIDIPLIASEDCGSLRADLADFLEKAARLMKRPLARRLIPEFYAEMNREGPLGRALRAKLTGGKASRINELVGRAVRRGELKYPPDPMTAAALIAGPVYWLWLVERAPADPAAIQHLATAIAAALTAHQPLEAAVKTAS
jgi:AcrR family transcriptional regulator